MEFSEYVDARRTTLVRAAVLMGHSNLDAEDLVQATLTQAFQSWRRIQRGDDVDTDVYRLLVGEVQEIPRRATVLGDELTPGMAARRQLAEMSTEDQEILVLRYFLDLPEATTAELLHLNHSEVSVADERSARTLVQEASETIDVAPAAFVPTPARRRTPVLGLVAAGFALVIGVGIALGWWSADEKPDDVEPGKVHQIPSVFGYDVDSARELLTAKGWDVTEVESMSCEPAGRALATVPQAGAAPSADQVKLLVSVPADGLGCNFDQGSKTLDRALAWQVLDFARSGSPIEFNDEVVVFVNGRRHLMSAEKATMRNDVVMQSLIRSLTVDAEAVRVEGGTWTTPLLTTKVDQGDSLCAGLDLPKGFGDRESLLMYVALPAFNSTPTDECHFLNVFTTGGVVDGLVLRTGLTTTPQGPTVSVPNVVGMDVDDAREALLGDGFTVRTRKSDGCPGTNVVEQTPEAGVLAKYHATVRLEIGREAASVCL